MAANEPPPTTSQSDIAQLISNEEMWYNETHKSLIDALSEQKVLKEKLKTLGMRNKPAEWGKPIQICPIETEREADELLQDPRTIIEELSKVENLLQNTRKTKESLIEEKTQIQNKIDDVMNTVPYEIDRICNENLFQHRATILSAQQSFEKTLNLWAIEKTKLLSCSEKLSIDSHQALHTSTLKKEGVEAQRTKISKLAYELRQCLSKAKELRDLLEEQKQKVNLIDTLTIEIDQNKAKSNHLIEMINQQKLLLGAKKVSKEATEMIKQQNDQIKELTETVIAANSHMLDVQDEKARLEQNEISLKEALDRADEEFRRSQTNVLVLDSEIAQLKRELERASKEAKDEGRKNVDLNRRLREEKIEAAESFLERNVRSIHRPDKVVTSLDTVREQLSQRPKTAATSYKPKIKRKVDTEKPRVKVKKAERPKTLVSARRKEKMFVK